MPEWVRAGPDPTEDGVVRWRRVDLQSKIAVTFKVHMHERSVGKLLARLGFSHISVRPRHPQADASAQEAHKKIRDAGRRDHPGAGARQTDRALVAGRSAGRPAGSLTYIWAEQGSRPPALHDQGRDLAYIFGAVCPTREIGAGLVLPEANAEAMNLHLVEISRKVSPNAFAVVRLDGAGWHQTGGRLKMPNNLALLHLPPYSTEP